MVALWMLVNCKNGVSSYEISRATSMGQKAAWFVLQRLRYTLNETAKMGGKHTTIEIDECYIGGKPKNMHRGRRIIGQNDHKTAIVMGFLQRDTREVRIRYS